MTPHERERVVAAALAVADDLDARLYPAVGVLRQLAQIVATTPASLIHQQCARPGCDQGVTQNEHGRPRLYCSTRCKKRATRERGPKVGRIGTLDP